MAEQVRIIKKYPNRRLYDTETSSYITLAEAIDPQLGLGAMINISERTGPREHVLFLLFGIAILAFLLDMALRTIQRGVFTWRKDL